MTEGRRDSILLLHPTRTVRLTRYLRTRHVRFLRLVNGGGR